MSNVIQFSVRSVNTQSPPRADSAEIIAFPNRHRHSSERDLYVRALVRMSFELKAAKDARKRRLVSELRDEIDVIALFSEEMGFRDIAACCRNILRSS